MNPTPVFRMLRGFGRGVVRSGAIRPLAYGTAGLAVVGYAAPRALDAWGRKNNPQLQTLDTTGDGNPDVAFDPKTGKTLGFGTGGQPTFEGDPDRNADRDKQRLMMTAVVAIVAVGAVLVMRGS
jgi:hypothetical protein